MAEPIFFGAQDQFCENLLKNDVLTFDDEFKSVLTEDDYTVGEKGYFHYKSSGEKPASQSGRMNFHITDEHDAITDLELVFTAGTIKDIDYIELDIGSTQFQRFSGHEQIRMHNYLHGVETEETRVPIICLSKIFPLLKLKNTEFKIWLQWYVENDVFDERTSKGESVFDVKLVARRISITNDEKRQQLLDSPKDYMMFAEHFTGSEGLESGKNIRLNFTEPTNMIYCYGFDKTKAKRITINLGDQIVISKTIDELEQVKRDMGIDSEHVVIFMNKGVYENNSFVGFDRTNIFRNGTINFSKINKPYFAIETDEVDRYVELNIVSVNHNVFRCANGKIALKYSK